MHKPIEQHFVFLEKIGLCSEDNSNKMNL